MLSITYCAHIQVLWGMALNSCIILSNCAEEHDFSILYTAPGVVDWPGLLEHWLLSPLDSIRYYAKVIAGCISLDEDQYFLLDLTENEISTLLKMLKDISVSKALVASGFGCQFSVQEVLSMISNFILSKNNFAAILYDTCYDVVEILVELLKHPISDVKKCVCNLLLKLFNSLKFRKKAITANLDKVLNELVDESDDVCLSFLKQCVLFALSQGDLTDSEQSVICYDLQTSSNVAVCFGELLTNLSNCLSEIILRYEGRLLIISEKRYPNFNVLFAMIRNMFSFWSSCCMDVMDVLLQQVCRNDITILHGFAMMIHRSECYCIHVCKLISYSHNIHTCIATATSHSCYYHKYLGETCGKPTVSV